MSLDQKFSLELILKSCRFIVLIFSSYCAGCAAEDGEIVILRAQEEVLDVRLQQGQKLRVRTNPVPLTAFHWEIDPLRTSVIEQMSAAKLIPANEKGLLGGETRTEFSFIANKRGEAAVHFVFLFRDAQRDSFVLNITVR